MNVHLGFEVGTGKHVSVPLAHTFVTGQTQLSGKTTTLQALVGRAGKRSLAFSTKRGESLGGRRIKPFLPRENEPIHWRLVETILASALGQRAMKYERYWLIEASKGAMSLAGVQRNVERLLAKAKGGRRHEAFTLIREYLELVVPDMLALNASAELDLQPGLNVMDLAHVGPQLQALVIRAALERINRKEHDVVVVFPEAWEFAPRGRSAPAKDEAIALVRKGAVVGNWLLCDSQDIAGVDENVRRQCSVWLLGVQRELNEVKRTLDMMPGGIRKPKADDVAGLGLGEFFACWGRHAVKVYVQPTWMSPDDARDVALGELELEVAALKAPRLPKPAELEEAGAVRFLAGDKTIDALQGFVARGQRAQAAADAAIAAATVEGEEEFMSAEAEKKLDRLIAAVDRLGQRLEGVVATARPATSAVGASEAPGAERVKPAGAVGVQSASGEWMTVDALYEEFRSRLLAEAADDPVLLRVLAEQPSIEVAVRRHTIEVDGDTLRGRLARLIVEGVFDDKRAPGDIQEELRRRGFSAPAPNVGKELAKLAQMGFLTRSGSKWYQAVEGMERAIVERDEPVLPNQARRAGGR